MSKIKLLDKSITNRISAGEVVEKPASIVKELLENSIDAGADRISIEIENGGIAKIAITDNGSGMDKEDLTLAITPHATSKISSIEDLDNIATLGFRGEALASIASVSKMEIISKTQASELGSSITSDGGQIIAEGEIASPKGTYVEVNSLFYNTPVRAKFLRKPKTEEADITDYVERIMLAFPQISFKYIIDGKIKYNTSGSGLSDNIYTIYGKEVAENLVPVEFENNDYKVVGYIGKPEISKPNRNYQTLLVSNRYVKNYMVSSAIQNAYDNFLMKNKFPFFVLNLLLPHDNVDVNVHPNKLEVKFEKPNYVFSTFYSAVINALNSSNQIKDLKVDKQAEQEVIQHKSLQEMAENEGVSYKDKNKNQGEQSSIFGHIQTNLSNQELQETKFIFNKSTFIDSVSKTPVEVTVKPSVEVAQEIQEDKKEEEKQPTTVFDIIDYKIVGTLFKTYNIIENGNDVLFVDQHAAHERILFDKYMNEIETNTLAKQTLLIPYILNVKDVETQFLNSYLPHLNATGFDMEEFGHNTFKVTAVPYVFASVKLGEFFADVLNDINEVQKQPVSYLKHTIATKACRSAVKAGNNLTDGEIKLLFENMKKGVLHCPHGRPFVMKLDRLQVEKWFKRVL